MHRPLIPNIYDKPLYSFFDVSPTEFDKYLSFISGVTMQDIGFVPCDCLHFKRSGVFCFDPVSDAFNFSVAYLYRVFQEKVFGCFVEYFLDSFKNTIGRSPSLAYEAFNDTPVQLPLTPEYLLPLKISRQCLPVELVTALSLCGIDTWRELSRMSEKKIALKFGFFSCDFFKNVELLLGADNELQSPHAKKFFLNATQYGDWSTVKSMLESWLDRSINSRNQKRDIEILMKRFGWDTSEPMTLDAIAIDYGQTRERIRQIEKKWIDSLLERNSGEKLGPLWVLLDDFVKRKGVTSVEKYYKDCASYFEWEGTLSRKSIGHILRFCPKNYSKYFSFKENYLIANNVVECITCDSLVDIVNTYFDNIDSLELDELKGIVRKNCELECKRDKKPIFFTTEFFDVFFRTNFSKKNEVTYDREKNIIYSKKYYDAKFGSIVSTIEQLMIKSRRPLHFKAICKIYNEFRQDKPSLERNIHASLSRTPNVILWGRGIFVHKNWTYFPYELIRKIEDEVYRKLDRGLAATSSFALFTDYQSQLILQGIPNEIALYSVLKISDDQRLAYPHQPYIVLRENANNFSSLTVVLEDFIADYGELVSPAVIQDFVFNELGLKEFQVHQLTKSITDIYGSMSCGYVHECNLNLDESYISPLLEYTVNLLNEISSVSLKKIFDEQSVLCGLLRISSPIILGYVLENNGYGKLEVVRNNKVVLASSSEHQSIEQEIVCYVRSQGRPCSYAELYENFVEQRGYGESSIHSAFYRNDALYRYLSGCTIYGDVVGLTDAILSELMNIISSELNSRISAGELFASVSDIVEKSELPCLEDGYYWNEILIADIINKSNKYKMLGGNMIVFVSKQGPCKSLEQLIWHLLDSKFNGSENIKKFTEYLSSLKIINKSIPSSILNNSENFCVQFKEISIRGSYVD